MKRHVGRLTNTGQRCVVAFMQIPGREDHALVIPTDTLPPRYEQAVMEVVESPEGQADESLANVLARRLMPDVGKNVLQALHEGNMLMPVPVNQIIMLPMPNMPFPLTQILADLGRTVPNGASLSETHKFNPHLANQQVTASESTRGIANNLIIEAQMLEAEAAKKRAQAYRYAPELEPRTLASTQAGSPSAEAVTETLVTTLTPKRSRTPRAKKSV